MNMIAEFGLFEHNRWVLSLHYVCVHMQTESLKVLKVAGWMHSAQGEGCSNFGLASREKGLLPLWRLRQGDSFHLGEQHRKHFSSPGLTGGSVSSVYI